MRSRSIGAVVCLALLAGAHARAADHPRRKLLSTDERNAVLTLIKAVDAAQSTDVTSDGLPWINHIFKSANQTAYFPFRLLLAGMADAKSAVVYVRAVSRHDGIRAADERSAAREWLARGEAPPPRIQHTVFVNPGEMPIGGPATTSSR